jgi:hypothetical protein
MIHLDEFNTLSRCPAMSETARHLSARTENFMDKAFCDAFRRLEAKLELRESARTGLCNYVI